MNLRPKLLIGVLVAAVSVLAIAIALSRDAQQSPSAAQLRAGAFQPPRPAAPFTLEASDGSQVSLANYRGKAVLLTFGFTSCAAVCPTTLATLAQARKALGSARTQVQVLFVTVDPERDTATRLDEYVKAFDPTFIGATGSAAVLAKARQSYGVTATREGTGPDYAVAHTSSIFLIGPDGKLRAMMPFGRPADDFVHDVKLLLADKA